MIWQYFTLRNFTATRQIILRKRLKQQTLNEHKQRANNLYMYGVPMRSAGNQARNVQITSADKILALQEMTSTRARPR
jgi:hypothetical protein